ncbi:MAG: Cna B-type domain-containing protein [Bifidobacteriaceae bacterium]|nr:Cna B-type domain-containing protein [Bifidobacteriaceae bacterium]
MPGTTSTSNPYAVPKGTRVKLTCLGSVPAGYVAEYLWTDAAGIQLGTDPELEYAAVDAPVWAYCEVTARLNATSASAFIRFDDANNQDGKRPIPYTTTVELWQQVWNGSSYGSATHVAGKDITATIPSGQTFVSLTPTEWTGLPVGSDPSHPTKYQAVAVTVPTDYTATYTYTGNTDTEITLTHVPETTSVTVTKVWADTGFETLRPAAITVQILANGTPVGSAVTLNGSESTPWSFTQTGLAKYAAGSLITYTVTEGLPSGAADPVALSRYARTTTRTTTTTGAYVFTVTNTFDQTYLNHTVTKVWQDDGDRDGLRPASIQVQLEVSYPVSGPVSDPVYGAWAAYTGNIFDGSALVAIGGGNTVTLSGTDTTPWAYQWTGLPAYVVGGTYDNVAVKYRAREISTLPTGYTTTYGDDGFTITNAHTPATTSFTVRKVWDDGDDLDGLRESPSFTLSGGGQTYGPVTIPTANLADDVWTYRWTGVPENSAGSAITYVVIEGDIPAGYAITATGGLTPHDLDNTDPDTTTRVGYEITNTHVPTTVLIDPDDLFVADETKVYGEPDPSPFHINGLPAGSYTATFTRTPGEDVGLYAIRVATLTFTDPNFRLVGTIADITPGTLTITKRPVVVQVGTQTVAETGQTITRCLAATAGTTGVGPSGLVSGHQLAPACVNASGVAPGTYPAGAAAAAFSVLDGGSDVTSNYDVTVADGALIITAVEGPGDQGTSGPSPSTSPGPAASPSPGASTPPAVTPSVTPSGQGKVPAGPTVAPSAAPSPGASLPVMGSDATTPATLALLLAALGLLLLAKARRARLAGPPKHRA